MDISSFDSTELVWSAIEKMRKKPNYNDVARKWPLPIRKGIKISNDTLGILEITIEGETEITSQMLEHMKKDGYIFHKINTYTYSPKSLNDIKDEDDASSSLLTSITFREHEAPPLENGGKSDEQALKKIKPQQTEIRVGPRDSVCSGCSTDHHQGDDVSR
jgi:hypothetical protein